MQTHAKETRFKIILMLKWTTALMAESRSIVPEPIDPKASCTCPIAPIPIHQATTLITTAMDDAYTLLSLTHTAMAHLGKFVHQPVNVRTTVSTQHLHQLRLLGATLQGVRGEELD